jgi:hypothetical protein
MSLDELLDYCAEHQDSICVRSQVNGKWENVALSQVPFWDAVRFVLGWYDRKHLPVHAAPEQPEAPHG